MANKNFNYTKNMKSIFDERTFKLLSFYCREDFIGALNDYDAAKKDNLLWRKRDLQNLCNARGIYFDKLIKDRSLLETIPTRADVQEELLQSFYDLYKAAPDTKNMMERIVRRLAPEYNSDTVRLAILKKFVVGAGENCKHFKIKPVLELAKSKMNKEELAALKKLDKSAQVDKLLEKIDESVFDSIREVKSLKLTLDEVLKLIVVRIEKFVLDDEIDFEEIELSEQTLNSLNQTMDSLGLEAEDAVLDKLKKLNEVVQNGKLPIGEDTELGKLIAQLDEDFSDQLKTINRISQTGRSGTAFDLYAQAKKDALKAKKKKSQKTSVDVSLLEICNDLAKGNFRVNGKTKVALYYFAFMFGLKLNLNEAPCEPEKDIEKNLFHDFYNDNLLRVLSDEYADSSNATSIETEPTGEGINYKSYVEVIYLYYLCKDDLNLTPGEKIDRAEKTILECVEKDAKDKDNRADHDVNAHTQIYRDVHMNAVLNLPEKDLVDYIHKYFQIYSKNGTRIMVASEENTASDLIDELMEYIDEAYPEVNMYGKNRLDGLSKKLRDDDNCEWNRFHEWKIKSLLENKFADDSDFLKVLDAIDKRTHNSTGRFSKAEKERMLMMLHVLSLNPSKTEPWSIYKIQSHMYDKGISLEENQLSTAITNLMEIGYDIKQSRSKGGYCLRTREYDDPILNELLERVTGYYYVVESKSEYLLSQAIVANIRFDKRITRCELIALHFNLYISLMYDTDGLDTFPDVFSDYVSSVNPYLEEARYQPISEKNIFDTYIIIALYFYLLEHNGYMTSNKNNN